ncbi:DUF262 domain-containing protein [Variovorax soli]|uniref:GmrSD restriction endonucleases N-terminal domain-containing protein n=1 Tax=Variovorax soli TaxID=376815 RepID=A0ABU1NLY6_9BURK|nr:DUF262 domain-containing protein [Variovorax soli]MDR6539469.1 hypothetical protein [Variovorax soli]
MSTQRYSVTPHAIETLLTWVKSGEIAIPEIQRPFVWDATKVRNLLDSLYQGYPVGYLIAWRNPTVKLKDGTASAGKRILIDGQQRVTALMASLLGVEVLTDEYETVRIRIAFNPQEETFEVANPAIRKSAAWISDVAEVFNSATSMFSLVSSYCAANPGCSQDAVFKILERLRGIVYNHVGIIELAGDLDIETVTEIFIRVNSAGAALSQADFAMSKIAVNETYGGNLLRKAIDYFCHLAVAPGFLNKIQKGDKAFVESEFFPKMQWMSDVNDDIYDPTYTDMLRVAFTSEFGRGKLQDLVALLSGRNFETKEYEEVIAENSFLRLKSGILAFMNKTHFDRITMILRSAGFVTSNLVFSQNAVNFAYILYLRGRAEKIGADDLERLVRRWYVMSLLRGRYSGSPESQFDFDIRQISSQGLVAYVESVLANELPDSFWTGMLPQFMATSSIKSPYFLCYQAAQVKLGDRGFLSRDITAADLLLNRADVHHVYPRKHLKDLNHASSSYNQIANYVIAQSEINIAIGAKSPETYFTELQGQINGGDKKYGGIVNRDELVKNLRMNCIPESMLDGEVKGYEAFLEDRRKLMALKIKTWFEALG